MVIIGLDPGCKESALLVFNGEKVLEGLVLPNEDLLRILDQPPFDYNAGILVVERMQTFTSHLGVGSEVFDSEFWAGRFVQAWSPRRWERLLRSKVRAHLQVSKGGDAAVRASLIDRFGPYKADAIGTKKSPGPLYGVTGHLWSALAVAITWADSQE